jgi:glutamate synthase domain-containing protein 1
MNERRRPRKQALYDPWFEHDACGVGFVANIDGERSHDIIKKGLQVLQNLTHRGACGCDPLTGDGAGMLVQLPHEFFHKVCDRLDIGIPKPGEYGAGLVFLPRDVRERDFCKQTFERIIREEGQKLLGWRRVPVAPAHCGDVARSIMPEISQVFIGRGRGAADAAALERKLFIIRKRV